jgi:plasmid stabilization system protein ParE
MRLRYSGDARHQILEIGELIAQDSPTAAKRVVPRFATLRAWWRAFRVSAAPAAPPARESGS